MVTALLRGRFAGLRAEPPSAPWLLVAVLGAPSAWALHLFASYGIVGIECNGGLAGALFPLTLILATLVLGGAGVTSGVVAFSMLRPSSGETLHLALGEPAGRVQFLAGTGALLAAIFVLLIVLQGVVPLLVPTCAQIMRLAT
jgi:hypothetical protein